MSGLIQHALSRECILLWRSKSAVCLPWLFYIMVMTLLLFAVDPFEPSLQVLLPRLFVVALLLSLFMLSEQMFHRDAQSGYLVQYLFDPLGFNVCMLIKMTCMLVFVLFPLLVICTLVSFVAAIDPLVMKPMLLALLFALPTLFLLTTLTSVLTLTLPRSGLLNAIILVPFYLPVLLFCESLIMRAQWGEPYAAYLYLLAALMLTALVSLPALIIAGLRHAMRAL